LNSIPRIRAGLLHERLDNEVLVYDASSDRVHLLDPTTGFLYELLDQGQRNEQGITTELARLTGAASSEELFALSVDELRKAGLLEATEEPTRALEEITRRGMLQKLAIAGVAAVLIPAIATLTAGTVYGQGSCRPQCAPCTADAQCCTHCDASGGTQCGLVRDICP
jgi:PqqD family protein of HPr-rel-A system